MITTGSDNNSIWLVKSPDKDDGNTQYLPSAISMRSDEQTFIEVPQDDFTVDELRNDLNFGPGQ